MAAAAKDDAPKAPGDGLAAEPERAVSADEPMPATEAAAVPEDADARFDAARDRLRSTIEPPPDDAA